MRCPARAPWPTWVAIFAAGVIAVPARSAPAARDESPVVVAGAALPALSGRPVSEIAVFRYDPATSAFLPIPFQIDERVDHRFNPNTPAEFHELMYDLSGEDDGLLDADDEIVFLFGDAGPAAPAGTPWVAGADATRFEVTVEDPRPDAAATKRVYVFTGSALPRSPTTYVGWNATSAGDVWSTLSAIDFTDRWVLNAYRVNPPCGSGADLLDRVKGRAGRNLNLESEQEWNLASTYLGGRVGPIRAIRYVRGAASGLNTIHHDVLYRGFWERTVNLRVHAIAAVALYFDLLPRAGTRLYTPRATAGAAVDGVPDPGVSGAFVPWAVVRGPDGGYVVQFDMPASPLYATKLFYYRDDASYDDAVSPLYDDEDDAAYGAHGVELRDLSDSETSGIPFTFRIYPLCAGVGDDSVGAAYQALADVPLVVGATPQARVLGPVNALRASRAAGDVALAWDPVPGASGYRVYATGFADTPHASWSLIGQPSAPAYVDPGAAGSGSPRFYSVVAVAGTIEGDW